MSYMQGKNLGGGGGGVNVIENLMGQGQSMKQQQQPPPVAATAARRPLAHLLRMEKKSLSFSGRGTQVHMRSK